MGLIKTVLDGICFLYFLTHIPITILVDSQSVLPKELYPKMLRDTLEWYCHNFKDPMMMDPPIWFKSFCVCELVLQLPFFFVALPAFLTGSTKWIRTPLLIYSAHVATTLVPIIAHIMFNDFSGSKHPAPSTMEERLKLVAIYSPYLLIPLLMLLRALCTSESSSQVAKERNITGAVKTEKSYQARESREKSEGPVKESKKKKKQKYY